MKKRVRSHRKQDRKASSMPDVQRGKVAATSALNKSRNFAFAHSENA